MQERHDRGRVDASAITVSTTSPAAVDLAALAPRAGYGIYDAGDGRCTKALEEGTSAGGVAATVDPLAAYSFEFAVPALGLDATLSSDVPLDSLDADAQAALLAALDAGTATLVTKGGEAGDTYQAFPLCTGGAVPTADGCILVAQLDADGQPTTGPPAIVRFTGVTGHFSTWGVAVVEPLPPPDPRTQLESSKSTPKIPTATAARWVEAAADIRSSLGC